MDNSQGGITDMAAEVNLEGEHLQRNHLVD